MKSITDEEMKNVQGGINIGLITAVATAVIFITGIIAGLANPTKCNHS